MFELSSLYELFKNQNIKDWKHDFNHLLKEKGLDTIFCKKTEDEIKRDPIFLSPAKSSTHLTLKAIFNKIAQNRNPDLPWSIQQSIDLATPKKANEIILSELQEGSSALLIHLDPSGKTGVEIKTHHEFETLFQNVNLEMISISFCSSPYTAYYYLDLLTSFLKKKTIRLSPLQFNAGLAPLDNRSKTGIHHTLQQEISKTIKSFKHKDLQTFPFRLLTIDTSIIHQAGGSSIQEIAYALSSAVYYLKQLELAGIPVAKSSQHIEFRFAVTQDIHLMICKLRAARACWSDILTACNLKIEDQTSYQTAITSKTMLTSCMSELNLIRNMMAGFSAVIAGVDALTILPHNLISKQDENTSSRRLARNLHFLLQKEMHYDEKADYTYHSCFHETLTHELAEKSWQEFQKMEKKGGIGNEEVFYIFSQSVKSKKQKIEQEFQTRSQIMIGVNQYASNPFDPKKNEISDNSSDLNSKKDTIPTQPSSMTKPSSNMAKSILKKTDIPVSDYVLNQYALTPFRYSQSFETLKKRSVSWFKQNYSVHIPIILLDSHSNLHHRIQYMEDICKIAGFRTKFYQISELKKDIINHHKPIPILVCGSNNDYYTNLNPVLSILNKSQINRHLWIANLPNSDELSTLSSLIQISPHKIRFFSSNTNLIKECEQIISLLEKI